MRARACLLGGFLVACTPATTKSGRLQLLYNGNPLPELEHPDTSYSAKVTPGKRERTLRVFMGATAVHGRLPPEIIRRTVRQHFPRFSVCYEAGFLEDPKLEGQLIIRFMINREGRVVRVNDTLSRFADYGVVACIALKFFDITFPRPDGGTVAVEYKIALVSSVGPIKAPDQGAASEPASVLRSLESE